MYTHHILLDVASKLKDFKSVFVCERCVIRRKRTYELFNPYIYIHTHTHICIRITFCGQTQKGLMSSSTHIYTYIHIHIYVYASRFVVRRKKGL